MHNKIKIKFCGMTNLEDAQAAIDLGVKYIGFILEVKTSARAISLKKFIQIAHALKQKNLNKNIKFVTVIMNKRKDFVNKLIETKLADVIQFHGQESREFCATFKDKIEIWKAFAVGINDDDMFNKIEPYITSVDKILLDKPKTEKEFMAFELYQKLKKYKANLILAGGLNLENIDFYIKKLQPDFIDLVSGVESIPGKKDYKKMYEFTNLITNHNAKNN